MCNRQQAQCHKRPSAQKLRWPMNSEVFVAGIWRIAIEILGKYYSQETFWHSARLARMQKNCPKTRQPEHADAQFLAWY